MLSGSIYVGRVVKSSLFYGRILFLWVHIYHNFFFNLSVIGHLHYFHVLTIVNNTALNMECTCFQDSVLGFLLGYIPRNEIFGPYSGFIFNFLRIIHIVFHGGYTCLQSHQQYIRVLFSSHFCQHVLYLVFFDGGCCTGMRL